MGSPRGAAPTGTDGRPASNRDETNRPAGRAEPSGWPTAARRPPRSAAPSAACSRRPRRGMCDVSRDTRDMTLDTRHGCATSSTTRPAHRSRTQSRDAMRRGLAADRAGKQLRSGKHRRRGAGAAPGAAGTTRPATRRGAVRGVVSSRLERRRLGADQPTGAEGGREGRRGPRRRGRSTSGSPSPAPSLGRGRTHGAGLCRRRVKWQERGGRNSLWPYG